MTRPLVAVEIEVYKPGDTEPFVVVSDGLESFSISERINDAMDSANFSIFGSPPDKYAWGDLGWGDYAWGGVSGRLTGWGDLSWGEYTWGGQPRPRITTGDKVVVRRQLKDESSLSQYWTGIVRNPTDMLEGNRTTRREVDATDFVFTVLSFRQSFENFEDDPIAGSDDAILDTLVNSECPEIGTSQLSTIAKQTDLFVSGRDLLSIVSEELAPTANAVVSQDGTDLVFDPLGDVSTKHELNPSDFRGTIETERNDDGLANLVRVDGGSDRASDDEQTVQDDYSRVTASSRITTQIQTRKSEVDRVLVHTKPDSNSDDNIRVRLQAERNGSPVDVSDTTSDIVSKQLAPEFLADDDLTTFVFEAHTLPPAENPFLIIEATGSTGHDIGIESASGDPTYRTEYPYPLLARAPSEHSQDEYRRRDKRIKDESLRSLKAVKDKSRSDLRQNKQPDITVSGEADSIRAHNLSSGEAVDMVGFERLGISGTYLCLERKTTFESTQITTELTLKEARSI